jgi:hypothetical protein
MATYALDSSERQHEHGRPACAGGVTRVPRQDYRVEMKRPSSRCLLILHRHLADLVADLGGNVVYQQRPVMQLRMVSVSEWR